MSHNCGDRMRKMREQAGLSQKDLAQKLDVSLIKINRIENDRGLPDTKMVIRLAHEFGVEPNWLLLGREGQEGSDALQGAPVYDKNELQKDPAQRSAKDWVRFPQLPHGCFAWEMRDESMVPRIRPGDMLLVRNEEYQTDDVVLFSNEMGLVQVRRIGQVESEQVLVSENPEYPLAKFSAEIIVLGKVLIGLRRFSP